ncbi:hypothetical protein [Streptomyces violascens]|uniref:Integral membrane protein n=1 Tax=Streptomyces violascens TaxID=67381 RepID=A0ABQ3QKD3_9ACTN|nr:hypothetical protein [Streptomyces violascens]GGT93621.1 hypothetical protein GCM10010289_12100 [Streptomyces violascens]GHI37740.1 hypothetical protein Sviol_21480 [Streptomyces violascens]
MKRDVLPEPVRRLAAHEAQVLKSFGLWIARRRHQVGPVDRAFGYASPQAATVYGLTFVCVVETIGLSFLVRDWPALHAVLLVLDLYTVVLVLGMQAAAVTRPHVLTPDTLRVRAGARVDLVIPLAQIARIRRELKFQGAGGTVPDDVLELSVGSQTSLTVELTEPITHVQLLGKRREVTVVRFHADEPGELAKALRAVVA